MTGDYLHQKLCLPVPCQQKVTMTNDDMPQGWEQAAREGWQANPAAQRAEYVERPTQVHGYRELSAEEQALVNRIKVAEAELADLWATVAARIETDVNSVWEAKMTLQDGFMWLVRSVTKPRDVFAEAEEKKKR